MEPAPQQTEYSWLADDFEYGKTCLWLGVFTLAAGLSLWFVAHHAVKEADSMGNADKKATFQALTVGGDVGSLAGIGLIVAGVRRGREEELDATYDDGPTNTNTNTNTNTCDVQVVSQGHSRIVQITTTNYRDRL